MPLLQPNNQLSKWGLKIRVGYFNHFISGYEIYRDCHCTAWIMQKFYPKGKLVPNVLSIWWRLRPLFFNRQINIIWISINGILFLWIPQYEFLRMSHPCIVMRPTVITQTVIAQIIADVNSMEICQKASHL